MKFILLKYLGIFFFFHIQVCVNTMKMSPEQAMVKCLRSTRASQSDANYLLSQPMAHPNTEHERCFLQCYFAYVDKVVIGSLGMNNVVKKQLDIVIGSEKPKSVTKCIEKEESSGPGEKCDIGYFTRLCHISFANELAEALGLEIKDEKFS